MINVTKLSRRRQREQRPPNPPELIGPLELMLLLIAQQNLGAVGVACVLAFIVIVRFHNLLR